MNPALAFAQGSRLPPKRAEEIAAELLRLHAQAGVLEPTFVVEAARSEDSPLHELFEWDDGMAAEKYRLEQARHLIRSVRVVSSVEDPARPFRVFVNLQDTAGYRTVAAIAGDQTLKSRALSLAVGYVRAAKARLHDIEGCKGIIASLGEIETELSQLAMKR